MRTSRAACALLVAVLLLACGCRAPSLPPASSTPVFDLVSFFSGATEGRGTLKRIFSRPHALRVHGQGHVEADGTLVLTQSVEESDEPPSTREWRIRRVGAFQYAGTLSDAAGPVAGMVEGNRLHLTFEMKHGLHAEQWIYLAADGKSAHNRMTLKKFGITVARVDEMITKTDAPEGAS